MINQRRAIIYMLLALVAAACGTGVPDREQSVWCYRFDFASSDYGIAVSNGTFTARGLESVDGVLGATYTHGSTVQSNLMAAEIEIIVPGARYISANISAFGISQAINEQFSQSGTGYLSQQTAEGESSIGDTATVSASTSSDSTIIVKSLEIQGDVGNNPFGSSNCGGLETPSPTPDTSETPTPTPTETLTPTITLTPTETLTPSPTIEPEFNVTCEYNYDFTTAAHGWAATGDNNGGSSSTRVDGVGWTGGLNITNSGNDFYGPDIYFDSTGIEVDNLYLWIDFNPHASVGAPSVLFAPDHDAILNEVTSQVDVLPMQFVDIDNEFNVYNVNTHPDGPIINPRAFHSKNIDSGDSAIAYAAFNCTESTPTPTMTLTPSETPTITETPTVTSTSDGGGPTPDDTSTPDETETPVPPTPLPTNTPYPTLTPQPTYTPYPTRTLFPTPTYQPTATPNLTATPDPNANDFEGDGTCENYSGTEPAGDANTGAWVEWQFFGLENIVNCVIIPRMDWLADLVNGIVSTVGSIYDTINNTFGYIRAAGEWVFGDLLHFIGGHVGNFIGQALWFLGNLFESIINTIQAVINLIVDLIAAVFNFIENLINFIVSAFNYAGVVLDAWNSATPEPPPGIPDCENAPLQHDLCAVYYIMENTLFAGIGAFIIPAITLYMSLLVAFNLLDNIIERIQKLWRVTD